MPKKRDDDAPYWVQMRESERSIITFALQCGETIRGAATLLGISPNYLSERVRELGVTAPASRPGPKPGTKPSARLAQPDLRVVPPVGVSRPSLPSSSEPLAQAEDEDENEDELEDAEDGVEDDLDEDGDDDEADDDEDEEEDDAEDDTAPNGEAQSGN